MILVKKNVHTVLHPYFTDFKLYVVCQCHKEILVFVKTSTDVMTD